MIVAITAADQQAALAVTANVHAAVALRFRRCSHHCREKAPPIVPASIATPETVVAGVAAVLDNAVTAVADDVASAAQLHLVRVYRSHPAPP